MSKLTYIKAKISIIQSQHSLPFSYVQKLCIKNFNMTICFRFWIIQIKIDLVLGHNYFITQIKTKQDIFVRCLDVSSIIVTVRWESVQIKFNKYNKILGYWKSKFAF